MSSFDVFAESSEIGCFLSASSASIALLASRRSLRIETFDSSESFLT